MNSSRILSLTLTGVLLFSVSWSANAQIVLTFEGLQNKEQVLDYYDNGPGGDYGVRFSPNALGIISQKAGGTGDIANLPSGVTGLYNETGSGITMNVLGGFHDTFSLYYSAPLFSGSIQLFDGYDGKGTLLATLFLPTTPKGTNGYTYDPFLPISVDFLGTARSARLVGSTNYIAFDNITFDPSGLPTVPEPGTTAFALTAALTGAALLRRRR